MFAIYSFDLDWICNYTKGIMFWNKKKKRIQKIELTENGFQVNYDGEIAEFQWLDIEKLIGFKVDRITVDDICLKIESNNKTVYASEEFKGWRNFMNRLLIEFPQIDKNWEVLHCKTSFRKKRN